MMTFSDLQIALRGGYLTFSFLLLCLSVCLIPMTLHRRSLRDKLLPPLCILINLAIILGLATNMKASRHALPPSAISRWCWDLPLWITMIPMAVMAVYLVVTARREWGFYRNSLTYGSIKESLDQIPTGLCFSQENGRVILSNLQMQSLCHRLAGRDLQNAELFWSHVSNGEVQSPIQRLSSGTYPHFRLEDGTVWTFSRQVLDGGIVQITAAETTRLQSLTEELREKNIQLAAMKLRLQRYSDNMEDLTRSREQLEIKARLHNDLGQALVATRRYLQDEDGTIRTPASLWRQNIAVLRMQPGTREDADPLDMMKKAAASAGVRIELQGDRPQQPPIDRLLCQAALEALTNAVRHAEATELQIRTSQTPSAFTIRLSNNGRLPEGPVTEGGGLGSLRRKVEYQGGSMVISCEPEFALTITVPKDWSEIP